MIRLFSALALALVASPAFAQTAPPETPLLIVKDKLVDGTPGDGKIVLKRVTAPGFPAGTVIPDEPCPVTEVTPAYSYTKLGVPCPTPPPPPAPETSDFTIAPPVITTEPKAWGTNATVAYGGRTNMHILTSMNTFELLKGDGPVRFADIKAEQAKDFIGPNDSLQITTNNVTIERVEAKVAKRGVYIRGDSDNWIVRDFRFTGGTPRTDSGIPAGIVITNTAGNILVERGYLSGFYTNWPANKYANGDCMSSERGNHDIVIRYVECDGASDGGFDLKSVRTHLDHLKVSNAGHYSYRIWAHDVTAGTLVSINPKWGHIQGGSTTDFVVDKFVAIGIGTLVTFNDRGGKVCLKEVDLTKWTGTKLQKGYGSLMTGPDCATKLN